MSPTGVAAQRLYIAADAAGYRSASDFDKAATRCALLDILDGAAAAAGLDRPAWREDERGRELAALTIDVPARSVAGRFVRELEAGLFRYNLSRRPSTRLCLHLILHCGQLKQSFALSGVVEHQAECVT